MLISLLKSEGFVYVLLTRQKKFEIYKVRVEVLVLQVQSCIWDLAIESSTVELPLISNEKTA